MNIENSLSFGTEKPSVLSIIKNEKINIIAIGLNKDQIIAKHKTSLSSLLTVLKGEIQFNIEGNSFVLNQFDTYQIPVNTEHEVMANEKAIFTLTQEK
jgi:quercetin dioxygenase-like cupin family protein